MKITHLISSLDLGYGGPVVALEGLCRGLQQSSDIRLQVVNSGIDYGGASAGGRMTELGIETFSGTQANNLREIVGNSTLVHVHGVWDPAFHKVILLCRRLRKPYIIRTCGMLDPWSLQQKRFKKWFYRAIRLNGHLRDAAAIHFTTKAEADLASKFSRPEQRLIEPNGVFLQDFTTHSSSKLRSEWGVPANSVLAIFLGRIHQKKGIEFLIRALKLRPELNLHLIIAGDGESEYVDQITRMAEGDCRIHFVGMLHGQLKMASLATADFFVLTSYQENFGNAVVEALASGTPVLITPGVNLADVVEDQKVGEVVELNDEAIASSLSRWVNNPQLIDKYAAHSRAVAGELFDWNEIGNRWVGHYQRLVEASKR